MDATQIYEKVQERYGSAAKSDSLEYGRKVATAFGYSEDELAAIPENANLGLSCGNPIALAKVSEGETVIDLGSGAGFDVFLAAKKVGASGKVIGVDMNKDMLERANRNKENAKADNVLFLESSITDIALPSATADCIISNCVVNLVPEQEKQLVFNEMFRLLKPGGRVAVSDILAKSELPHELKTNMALYVGCIAGASLVSDYEKYLANAGFSDTKNDLNVYTTAKEDQKSSQCCGENSDSSCDQEPNLCCSTQEPTATDGTGSLEPELGHGDFNKWAGSFKVYAVKP
ncbi:hypothetical protein GP486_000424 [Trichoglossum hirsutum]|uniref:Arsenite methyltransferase n=1 Tax=Trichoglossum hirsutum TaxID=265104 RepID=A0A9P8LIT2_9PEZI|nr:hypothetical protein GP486_000424 [Trichoglossum hirsutum]